jgi:hypothetical protein
MRKCFSQGKAIASLAFDLGDQFQPCLVEHPNFLPRQPNQTALSQLALGVGVTLPIQHLFL